MGVEIVSIVPPVVNLRPADENSVEMELLRDSIERVGLLQPIVVGDGNVIVDGYRRWLVCRGLGWTDVPVHKVSGDAEQLRVIAQTRRHEFGPVEKKLLIGSYLQRHPKATAGDIAHKFQWPVGEIETIVGVPFLIPEFEADYIDDHLPFNTVWHIARLKPEIQLDLFENYADDVEELHAVAEERLRFERAARRKKMTTRKRFRKVGDVVKEYENPTVVGPLLLKHKAETPLDGWRLALQWVLCQI